MGQLALRSEIPAQLVHEPLHFTLEPAQTNAPLLQEAVHQFVLFRVMSLLADKCPDRLLQLRVRNLVLVVTNRIMKNFSPGGKLADNAPSNKVFTGSLSHQYFGRSSGNSKSGLRTSGTSPGGVALR